MSSVLCEILSSLLDLISVGKDSARTSCMTTIKPTVLKALTPMTQARGTQPQSPDRVWVTWVR